MYFVSGVLDLVLNFPGYHRWQFTDVIRNILKIIVSLAWVIILPLFYVRAFSFAPEQLKNVLSFLHQVKGISPLYIMAVALYLLPNLLAAALFIFPMLRRWIENSDWHIIRLLLWWSQVLNRFLFPCSSVLCSYHLYHSLSCSISYLILFSLLLKWLDDFLFFFFGYFFSQNK